MNFFIDNFFGLVGIMSAPIMYFLGGRQQKQRDLKKTDVEIESAEVDYAGKVRDLYESLIKKMQEDKEAIKVETQNIISELRVDREELKQVNKTQDEEIKKMREDVRSLQKQFNDLYLAYAKEVEASKYWKDKFDDLEGKYNQLEKDHEALKKEFESYKKSHK